VHDDMIRDYEKKRASLQREIIALEFGHIGLAGTHTTSAIEIARHEIAAIDAALANCREKARRSR
jgi:hypothetical protein